MAKDKRPQDDDPGEFVVESFPSTKRINVGRELAAKRKKASGVQPSAAAIAQRVATARGKGPSVVMPFAEPLMTAARALMARTGQPIVAAFLHSEKLRGSIRKLSRAQWLAELESFIKAPR